MKTSIKKIKKTLMAIRKTAGRKTRKIAKRALLKVISRTKRKIPIHRAKVTTNKRNRKRTKTAQRRRRTKTKQLRSRNRNHSKDHKKFPKISNKQSSNKSTQPKRKINGSIFKTHSKNHNNTSFNPRRTTRKWNKMHG